MNRTDLQREAHAIAKSGSFAELQEQAAWSLAWQDIDGARAAIKAMKEFVAMAERDLEKLIAWTSRLLKNSEVYSGLKAGRR